MQQYHPNGSSHTLAPPPAAPHGPRQPSQPNGDRSRSASPDAGRRSLDSPRITALSSSAIEKTPSSGAGRTMDTLKRGITKLGLDVKRTRSQSRSDKGKKATDKDRSPGRDTAMGILTPEQRGRDDEETAQTPIQPTAKALGKRRAATPPDEGMCKSVRTRQRPGH